MVLPQDIRVHGYEEETGCTIYRNSKTGRTGRSVEEVYEPSLDMRFIYPSGDASSLDMRTPSALLPAEEKAEDTDPEQVETIRQLRVSERLKPYFQYSLVLGFGSGLLQFPLLSYVVVIVCDDNPGKLAVFSALAYLCYEIPRVCLVQLHGEVTDRLPRIPCIFASYCFEILLWFMICSYPNLAFILFLYFVRAIANIHTFAQSLYMLDLTLYVETGDLAKLKVGRRSSATTSADEVLLLTRAVSSEDGLKDLQNGSVSSGAYSGLGSFAGQIVGGVVLTSDAMSIQGALYLALSIMLVAQLLVLRLPETKPRVKGGPALSSLAATAVAEARDQLWAGYNDQVARWRAGEALLNDLTVFVYALIGGFTVYLFTLFNVFQYKLNPNVKERIQFGFILIAPFAAGVIAWIRHFRQPDKAEIYVMPYYLTFLGGAFFCGAFVNSYFGYLFVLSVVCFCIPSGTIPVGAMWASQAPVHKQGSFAAVCVILVVVAIGIPCVAVGLVSFMCLTGRWSSLRRHHRGSSGAKNDLRPAAPLIFGSFMIFYAAYKMKQITNRIADLTADRRKRDAVQKKYRESQNLGTFVDPNVAAGKATPQEAMDFYRSCSKSDHESDSDDGDHKISLAVHSRTNSDADDAKDIKPTFDDIHKHDEARVRAQSSGDNPMARTTKTAASPKSKTVSVSVVPPPQAADSDGMDC